MAKAESYDDLIFQLGDLARERLANKTDRPRAMNRVFQAEDAVVQRREELAELEEQMNEEDAVFQEAMAAIEEERREQAKVVKQFKRVVDAVEGRVKGLRKKLTAMRADTRYNKDAVKKAEARHTDLEMTSHDQRKIEISRQNLKKLRLSVMRQHRTLEDMEHELEAVLTPQPGQPGAPGLLAHKRIIELEDEVEQRRVDHEAVMAEIDEQIALKEQEVQAAEDYLDQATYLLGEETYAKRIPDPALAALYPRLDTAK